MKTCVHALRCRGPVIVLLCVLVAAVRLLPGIAAAPAMAADQSSSHGLPLAKASGFYGVYAYTPLPDGGARIQAQDMDAGFVIPFPRRVSGEKLEFRFRRLDNFRYFLVDFAPRGQRFLGRARINVDVPNRAGTVYYARIPDGNYGRIRLTFRSRNERGDAVLESIKVRPLGPWDYRAWPYAITLGVAVLLLLPGALLYVLLRRRALSESGLQVWVFAGSLVFYIVVYLCLTGVLALGQSPSRAHLYTLVFAAGLLSILLMEISRRRAWGDVAGLVRGSWQEVAAYMVLLLALCVILVHDANLPLQNMYFRHVAGPKTFGAFFAHDGMLQYVNGLAIADNTPFEKYYGGGQLIYGVADREMLPGIVYGAIRSIVAPLSSTLAGSYFVYTMLGVAMNLMIVFPAAAIARRFLGVSNTFLLLMLVSANAFMIGNYLITWFKMSAGALFLSGLYYLLRRRVSAGGWARSGLLFGLGANLHAGAVLGIPFFYLWALWRGFRERGFLSIRALAGPMVLVLVFAAAIAPWAVVKHLYFNEEYTEIKTHFLDGYSSPRGLAASARLFIEHTTVQQQYSRRLSNLETSFRLGQLPTFQAALHKRGLRGLLREWDKEEFNFLAYVLYPGALFAVVAWVYALRRRSAQDTVEPAGVEHTAPDRTGFLLWMSVATMVAVILAHYGRHPPDIVYHQPMGVLVLANMVLLGVVLRAPRGIRFAYYAYAAVALWRLFLFL
ncbi:MAG: hypothetical protein WB783_17925 [Arenicellales bacterium]